MIKFNLRKLIKILKRKIKNLHLVIEFCWVTFLKRAPFRGSNFRIAYLKGHSVKE